MYYFYSMSEFQEKQGNRSEMFYGYLQLHAYYNMCIEITCEWSLIGNIDI